jgi:hypothetical protein
MLDNLKQVTANLSKVLKFAEIEYLFHGTTISRAQKILDVGFQKKESHWDSEKVKSLDGVFFTRSLGVAVQYGLTTALKVFEKTKVKENIAIVILEIDNVYLSFDLLNLPFLFDFQEQVFAAIRQNNSLISNLSFKKTLVDKAVATTLVYLNSRIKVPQSQASFVKPINDFFDLFYDIIIKHEDKFGEAMEDEKLFTHIDQLIKNLKGYPHLLKLPTKTNIENLKPGEIADLLSIETGLQKNIIGIIECDRIQRQAKTVYKNLQYSDKIDSVKETLEKSFTNLIFQRFPLL